MVTSIPPTLRSQILAELLPPLGAGIRQTRLRACYAEEALQESLIALTPHIDRLTAMSERERFAYAWRVGSKTAMAIRKRVGLERARGTAAEVYAWEREVVRRSTTPEEIMRASEGAQRAAEAFDALPSVDRHVLSAVNDDGLSERDAANKIGVSRGTAAYRLRRARDVLARAWLQTTSWAGYKRRG